MTSKFALRSLLFALLAMGMFSVAKADIYVSATNNSGSQVGKIAPAPDMDTVEYVTGPVTGMNLIGYYGDTEVEVVIDTDSASVGANQLGGELSFSAVDFLEVYVTITN